MAILVEEGLHPNGMDLVLNGAPRAEVREPPRVNTIGIGGDDLLSAEAKLACSVDEEKGEVVIVVSALAGRKSALTGFRGGPIVLGEFARLPLTTIKTAIAAMMGEATEGPQ